MSMPRCISLLLALATATTASATLTAISQPGSSLLANARRLNNDNDDAYFSWVTDYSIKFDSCHTTLSFRADGGGGSGDGDEEPMELERLVLFKLCPTSSCHKKCSNGAEYVVELREYVESVYEAKMSTQEYNCEKVKENCACDDDLYDENVCVAACYAAAGLDYCDQFDSGDSGDGDDDYEFDIQEYMECRELEDYSDDDDNAVYVGPYCAGSDIRLGVFSDRQCSKQLSNSVYQSLTGHALPSTSLVDDECISCKEPSEYDDDYNADQYDEDEVTEICEELYDRAAKCEQNLKLSSSYSSSATLQTNGCNYIHNIMPQMERITKRRSGGGATASKVFMWLFLFTTIGATAVAYLFYTKAQRADVNLLEGSVFS